MRFTFTAPLWEWEAQGGWFFVSLPEEASADIREVPRMPRGFGAVKVRVRVGGTRWTTSVFPDSKRGAYVLPVKQSVRKAEGLVAGGPVEVDLEVVDL
ncbi:DUF1905 domain-containing protein [Agromyces sp. MMS24-JH15]|uniref:DUF1905 domain-containing protein n=1 Tax=Agromyces sp. MMS24-JH15 TaxID=3243765 RepID=UPI003748C27F